MISRMKVLQNWPEGTDLSKYLFCKVGSPWSSREAPQMEIIFLKRTLAIEEEVAFLHGNASVPVKTFKPARLVYVYPCVSTVV